MSKALVATLLLVAILLLVAHLEWHFAPAEENMRSAYLRPCDFTIAEGTTSDKMSSPQCYFFRERK